MSTPNPDNIWRLQAQSDVDGLVRALDAPDPLTRRRAAAALRTLGATGTTSALRMAISKELDEDTRSTMIAAIESLAAESGEDMDTDPQPSAVDPLAQELVGDDTARAIAAAHRMAELGDKTAVVPLILTFNNLKAPINLRLAVAEALLKLESAPVEVALLANLRHQDWEIRRNGAAILGQLKAEWAVEPLGKALGDPHPTVRKTALAALKYIGTPEARKVVARFATGLQRSAPEAATPTTGARSDPTLAMPQRSRLLDKPPAGQPETLPPDVRIMRVSERQRRRPDAQQSNRSTDLLDASVVDDRERPTPGGDATEQDKRV